jgi:hypothetical protein
MFIQNVTAIQYSYGKDGLLGNVHFDTRQYGTNVSRKGMIAEYIG